MADKDKGHKDQGPSSGPQSSQEPPPPSISSVKRKKIESPSKEGPASKEFVTLKISSNISPKISTKNSGRTPPPVELAKPAQEDCWEQQKSKRTRVREAKEAKQAKEAEPAKKGQTPSKPKAALKERLGKATTDAERLKLLLKPTRPPEERTAEVVSLMVSLPLSKAALAQPIIAWKQVIKTLTGHQPSTVSLYHPCKAELFFDKQVVPKVSEALQTAGYLLEGPMEVSERDLARRSEAYLLGYYLPLRRAALVGFSLKDQLSLLEMAEKQLPRKFTDPQDRKRWRVQINKDREWIKGMEI